MRLLESSLLINRRHNRRKNNYHIRRKRTFHLLLGCGAILGLSLAACLVIIGLFYADLTKDLPNINEIASLLNPENGQLLKPTQILDRSGDHILYTIENPGIPRRYLPIEPNLSEHLSTDLVQVTIALLEPNYWKSPGFEFRQILNPQPTTIAERLVSDLLLENEAQELKRSLRMRLLASQIVAEYGRSQVLEWYLNSAYFGRLAYGVESASQLYIGKSASELSIQEAALLIATDESPALNPFDAPKAAIERQQSALEKMYAQGFISYSDYQEGIQNPPNFQPEPEETDRFAKAFINLVIRELTNEYGQRFIERGGLTVTTSLDYDLQIQMTCTIQTQLGRLTNQTISNAPNSNQTCSAARLLPTLPPSPYFYPSELSASGVLLDIENGEVLALLGDTNSAVESNSQSKHQPGSLLSPFIALAGFSKGINPANLVWDIPGSLPSELSRFNNPDGNYHGPQRLRLALANDYLIPITDLLIQIGSENAWRLNEPLGLSSLSLAENPEQLLFQGGSTTPLELAQAYSTFANQGTQVGLSTDDNRNITPILIKSISAPFQSSMIETKEAQRKAVISTQLAYLVHDILSDEAARWPSLGQPNALDIGRPAGAKIGQVANGKEVWAVGYTPQRLEITWVGLPDEVDFDIHLESTSAAGIWHALMQYACQDLEIEEWSEPTGISTVSVCTPSGKLPTQDCPIVVDEIFLSGNEPTEFDDLYKTLQINRETNRLATVYTPPELINEETFLIVPPTAEEWAAANNFAVPPNDYDTIQPPQVNSDINIKAPLPFSYVNGEVEISGSALGEDFVSYRLQIGKGLNPSTWQQIDQKETPVEEDLLGVWSTNSYKDGLYAIRLIVTKENKEIETVTIQVTVDNSPPEIQILYPAPAQRFNYKENKQLTFQSNISDTVKVDKVKWYLDGKLIEEDFSSPYTMNWTSTYGEHSLTIEAVDSAGNTASSDPVDFIVE